MLAAGGLVASDVDEVVLVGRATRMPRIHSLLAEAFQRDEAALLSNAVRQPPWGERAPHCHVCVAPVTACEGKQHMC